MSAGWSVLERFRTVRFAPLIGGGFLALLLILSAVRSNLFTDSDLLSFDAADQFPNSAFAQVNAYVAARYRLQRAAAIPGAEGAQLRDHYLKKAILYFNAAIQRDDLTQFREEFKFRVDQAEMLMESGALSDAVACLDGFLPPAHLKMRDPKQEFRSSEFTEFYAAQTLARAWLVFAQVCLAQANPPGVSLETLPLKRRFELCDEAAAALVKSLMAFDWNQQAPYFAAAVELTRLELAKLAQRPDDVAKFKASARAQLEAISKTSPFYLNARKLLETLNATPGGTR